MNTLLRRSIPVVALAFAAAAPRAAVQGWSFTWKVTAEGSDGQKVERRTPPTMKVSLVPGKGRIDYVDNVPPGQKKGTFIILDAEQGTFTMVSPEDKTAMIMDPSALGNVLSAVGQTRLIRMEVSGVSTNVEKVGAGEKILGHATTKYRVTRDHQMDVTVLGRHNRTTHHSVTEMWYANDEFIADKAFEAWSKSFTGTLNGISGDAFKTLMEAEQKVPKGIVMKQVMKSTDTDDKGKVIENTFSMEMQELAKTSLDASLFTVPSGYQVTDMKAQMAAMSDSMKVAKANCEKEKGKGNCEMANLDSAMKGALKEGAKEGAADAAKKKLRGFFKKP
ncbi:MAG: DUF4412 domain-containing protein [Gemmatimonadaceae bacterium]